MQSGKVNPVAGIFLGKNNYGYQDKTEYVLTPNQQNDNDYSADEIRERYIASDQQKRLSASNSGRGHERLSDFRPRSDFPTISRATFDYRLSTMKLLRDFPGFFYAKIHGNFQKISRTRHPPLYLFNVLKQKCTPGGCFGFLPI